MDNQHFVMKKADKGSSVVLMNMEDYLAEGYHQLSDSNIYRKTDGNLTSVHNKRVEETARKATW